MSPEWLYTVVFFAWLAGAAMFVIGLHQMTSPATARGGNRVSALGMTIAVGTTLLYLVGRPEGLATAAWIILLVGLLIGGGVRRRGAGRHRRLPAHLEPGAGDRGRDDLRRPRRGHRLRHVHRIGHRGGQAGGPHLREADHDPRRAPGDRRAGGRGP